MTPISRPTNNGPVVGKVPADGGAFFLAASSAGERQHRDYVGEAPGQHDDAERRVEPRRIAVEARESRAVVGVGRGVGVEDLGQPVRAGVVHAVERGLQHHRRGREAEHRQRVDQHREHRQLHFARFDLLAEIFRRAADHQPGDEHGDDRDHEKTIEPRADAAWPDAAGEQVEQRHQAAERRQRIVHRVDRAGAGRRRRRRVHRAQRLPEANLLALEIAGRRVDAQRGHAQCSRAFRPIDHADADDEQNCHGDQDRATLLEVADRPAEGEHRSGRDEQQRPDFQHVGPGVGVLERMRRIGVHESAAVGAELLDDLLARHRTDRDGLLGALQRRNVDRAGQRLRHPEGDEDDGEDDRDRQQDVEDDAGHIDPEIADRGRRGARESAHQREGHGEARRCRQEVMDGEAEHLGEMTHRRLAAVVLPIGVGDEADRGVERQIRRNGVEALRIERQHVLKSLQRIKRSEADDREGDHRDRIDEPALFARLVDAGEAIKAALDWAQHRRQKVVFACVDVRYQAAQGDGGCDHEREDNRNLRPADECHGFTFKFENF